MKLLTLNTHSVISDSYEKNIDTFVNAIIKHAPDVIALQEVMQPYDGKIADLTDGLKYVGEIPIKEGNFLKNVLQRLKKHKEEYNGVYYAFKRAYDMYDEGLAILSKSRIDTKEIIQLSSFNDYINYKTRFALGVRIDETWFYSVHFNWENDTDSPFKNEWSSLLDATKHKGNVYIMGDFNITPHDKGYEEVLKSYFDTYMLAKDVDNGITVKGKIDGWEESTRDKRIDYIFTSKNTEFKSSHVIFNGKNEEIISDHFGILLEKE